MPTTCIVAGCGNRSNRDDVKFFCVPTILNHKFLIQKNELSKKRREMWIGAIKRDDLTESKLKYERVCSKHFITGRPASLEDENHPDWVPSQCMGHKSLKFHKRESDVERKTRVEKRRKLESVVCPTKRNSAGPSDAITEDESERSEETGVSSQTDLTMADLSVKLDQLNFASNKIAQLQKKVDMSPFSLMNDCSNDNVWKYYTGFDYNIVYHIIYLSIEPFITTTSTSALSKFNQVLLTLIKLRLDLHFKDIAFRFNISATTASKYFEYIITALYQRFKTLIIWPERSVATKNIPSCFRNAFQNKTTVIIDCFEVFIERPPILLTQQQCWSNYKHHNTIKFLVGITPQGSICYISTSWGGRASDRHIVENSNFCTFIMPGDVVLADRGFLIKETLAVLQAKLVIPAFTKGKNQLHPIEIEESRHIAQVRIHVERVIGLIKNKFNILTGTIPLSMIKKGNDPDNINILDKIVVVCCALINLSPPVIPI